MLLPDIYQIPVANEKNYCIKNVSIVLYHLRSQIYIILTKLLPESLQIKVVSFFLAEFLKLSGKINRIRSLGGTECHKKY